MGLTFSLGVTLSFQIPAESRAPEATPQCFRAANQSQSNMIIAIPEAHLVAGFDAESIAQRLRYDDLAFRSNRMSHT